jgi:hypothetical protein
MKFPIQTGALYKILDGSNHLYEITSVSCIDNRIQLKAIDTTYDRIWQNTLETFFERFNLYKSYKQRINQ